ncbi:hypothetical protein [Pararhizobium antarcticum]|uniref:hypothetical protein n=1 Tax=Pararhizobium antarcticum TaxID=1798805 RepID=UPI000A66B1A5|nr:hypothetical protein [Pararhizobium antarcticum]
MSVLDRSLTNKKEISVSKNMAHAEGSVGIAEAEDWCARIAVERQCRTDRNRLLWPKTVRFNASEPRRPQEFGRR